MPRTPEESANEPNYSFLLKCMAGLATAALVTALFGLTAAKLMVASTALFLAPIISVALIAIALSCVIPFCLFRSYRNNSEVFYHHTNHHAHYNPTIIPNGSSSFWVHPNRHHDHHHTRPNMSSNGHHHESRPDEHKH